MASVYDLLARCIDWATGNAKVQLTGSTIQDTQTAPKSIPYNQAMKDIAMRAYENIIDIIGAENINLLLPMWETSDSEFKDLLRPSIKFLSEGPTLGQAGLLHPMPFFDGVNDKVRHKPFTENTVGSTEFALTNPSWQAAQKITAQSLSGRIQFIMVTLKKVGNPDANVVFEIVEDNSGQPTGAVLCTTEPIDAANIATNMESKGFYFASPVHSKRNKVYWLRMKYENAEVVDASNYIAWAYDSAGGYGQPRATYDGTTWTIQNGQSHVFAIYPHDIVLTGDFSIIITASRVEKSSGSILVSPNIGSSLTNTSSFGYSLSTYLHNILQYSPGAGISYVSSYNVRIPSNFSIWCQTFSKSASADKLKLYWNLSQIYSLVGTANEGVNMPQQPFVVGAGYYGSTGYGAWYSGLVGCLIVTSNVLTFSQYAKVYNQLLALRRLREAV